MTSSPDFLAADWGQELPGPASVLTARLSEMRTAAQSQGYAVGWAQGRRAGELAAAAEIAAQQQSRDAELAAALAALRQALTALDAAATTWENRVVPACADVRDSILDAALTLTETLLGRELSVATEPGLDALRRALNLAPSGRPATVRLHPGDAEQVRAALVTTTDLGRDVLVVADAAVEAGGAVVECDAGRIDAQIGPALARVRALVLTP
ncbi:MAG: FliH/SctL family protein [Sporichthyaceae bacterium]